MKKYDIELRSRELGEAINIYEQPSFLLDEEIEAENEEDALDIYKDYIEENIYSFVDEPDNLIINCDGSEIEVINKEKNIKEIYCAKKYWEPDSFGKSYNIDDFIGMIDDEIQEKGLNKNTKELIIDLIEQLEDDDIVVIEYGDKEYGLDIDDSYKIRKEAIKKIKQRYKFI